MGCRRKIGPTFVVLVLWASLSCCPEAAAEQTQRQTVLDAMKRRPDEPWPRGLGHVVLGVPGSPRTQKAYHEPGGSFSPCVGSFGVSIRVAKANVELVATSDSIPIEQIKQQYVWTRADCVPGIRTDTDYYRALWTFVDHGQWRLDLKLKGSGTKRLLYIRSVGPAGGPVNNLAWDGKRLLINHRWVVSIEPTVRQVRLGDEQESGTAKGDGQHLWQGAGGWGFARIELEEGSDYQVIIRDTAPQSKSPLTFDAVGPGIKVHLPDKRFEESLRAQAANLMMGYVGRQTCPGEPTNYPLAWERDGAYSLLAMARCGRLETARDLSVYFAKNDFFGGFGAEGDAPGSAINALVEVAVLLDDSDYYRWLWPNVKRKADIIFEMLEAKEPVRKQWVGPIVPRHRDRDDLAVICKAARDGLAVGLMDHHNPILYINAVSYRGLLQAGNLAEMVGEAREAARFRQRAAELQKAWVRAFATSEANNERTYICSIWPSWVIGPDFEPFARKLDERWRAGTDERGRPKRRPLWTYFTVAEAHQWLFLGLPERTWATLEWFWENQCSPGLYTYWEGSGEENTFGLWEGIRGWVKPPYVTPHYWTAAEMLLVQLDMLGYVDESGDERELVIGAGVKAEWLDKPMSTEDLVTKAGRVDWYWDGERMKVTVRGGRERTKVRLAKVFGPKAECKVEYAR